MSTAGEILVCDKCEKRIQVRKIDAAEYLWVAHRDGLVVRAWLAHKACDRDPDPEIKTLELAWFADFGEALTRVAAMTTRYSFTSQQLAQLVRVAWAVAAGATPEQAEKSRKVCAIMRGDDG
jgi:hypothetical protein